MKHTQRLAALMALVAGAVLLVVSPAAAQTSSGYAPGPCTAVNGTQDVGTVTVGQSFVLQVAPTCVFNVGASLTVTVNGVNIAGKVADANGFVRISITVTSTTQLSVDDPTLTPAVCGVNTVRVTGPSSSAQGGVSTQTANFTLTCPAGTGTGGGGAAGGGPTGGGATGAGTSGVAGPATPIQSRLSLTGANTLRFLAMALTLVVAGSMAVLVTHRRREQLT